MEGTDMPHVSRRANTCTAMKNNGDFCDAQSLPDTPFPICLSHAAQIMRHLNSVIPEADTALAAVQAIESVPKPVRAETIAVPQRGIKLIYYIRIGEFIKIGYSSNLHQRVRFYPPDAELLAYELGDEQLERKRLLQFRSDLRGRMEWFAPSHRLMAHIEQVRAALLSAAA